MKMTNEEIRLQEDAVSQGSQISPETELYRQLFTTLERQRPMSLPAGFAQRVMERLDARQRQSSRLAYAFLVAGIVVMVVATVVVFATSGLLIHFRHFKNLTEYAGLAGIGIVALLAFQWLDRRMLRSMS